MSEKTDHVEKYVDIEEKPSKDVNKEVKQEDKEEYYEIEFIKPHKGLFKKGEKVEVTENGLDYVEQGYAKLIRTCFRERKVVKKTKKGRKVAESEENSWSALKKIMRDDYQNTNIFNLQRSEIKKVKGKIVNKIYDYKKDVCMAYVYSAKKNKDEDDDIEKEVLGFIDEARGKKNIINNFRFPFYLYQLREGDKQYILFSEEDLSTQEYEITGTEIHISDRVQLGDDAKINTHTSVILVKKAILTQPLYKNIEDLFNNIEDENLTYDKWMNNFFYNENYKKSTRHPKDFEILLNASLFSSTKDFSGYPLHPLIFGEPGIQKSSVLEAIHQKLGESQRIVEGGNSTLRGLIPSFKSNPPDAGAFIKSIRILAVDEFLKLLMRCPADERSVYFSCLNPLLEHKESEHSSGNGRIVAKATARMFAVTNPVYGTHSMMDLLKNFEDSDSTWSRMLIWYCSKYHAKMARRGENIIESDYRMDNKKFLAIANYMQSFKSSFDEKKVLKIHNSFQEKLPEKVRDMYEGRYRHHILCIMDGIVKLRCLLKKDKTFTVIVKVKRYLSV